jgi:RNA polymerase sigma factor (sigma-70 family)
MLDGEEGTYDKLARRWVGGDRRAAEELERLCLPRLREVVGEELARDWFSEVRARGPEKIGYDPDAGGFLEWALDRVRLYERDSHRILVEKFYAGGDGADDAFALLYKQTRPKLEATLWGFRWQIGDEEVENIVTDFYFKFDADHKSGRSTYSPAGAPFLNWASRVVRNKAVDVVRRLRRRSSQSLEEMTHDPVSHRPADSPYARLDEEGFVKRLCSALPEEHWPVAVLLCYDQHATQKEIAEEVGYSESKVVRLINDIRPVMAKLLYDDGKRVRLNTVLKLTREKKSVKGLLPRMFMIYTTHVVLRALRGDQAWAPAVDERALSEEELAKVRPDQKAQVREVAEKIASLYWLVWAADPSHEFCVRVRAELSEPWCEPLAEFIPLEAGAPPPQAVHK